MWYGGYRQTTCRSPNSRQIKIIFCLITKNTSSSLPARVYHIHKTHYYLVGVSWPLKIRPPTNLLLEPVFSAHNLCVAFTFITVPHFAVCFLLVGLRNRLTIWCGSGRGVFLGVPVGRLYFLLSSEYKRLRAQSIP
jgi:hypothetical protein